MQGSLLFLVFLKEDKKKKVFSTFQICESLYNFVPVKQPPPDKVHKTLFPLILDPILMFVWPHLLPFCHLEDLYCVISIWIHSIIWSAISISCSRKLVLVKRTHVKAFYFKYFLSTCLLCRKGPVVWYGMVDLWYGVVGWMVVWGCRVVIIIIGPPVSTCTWGFFLLIDVHYHNFFISLLAI